MAPCGVKIIVFICLPPSEAFLLELKLIYTGCDTGTAEAVESLACVQLCDAHVAGLLIFFPLSFLFLKPLKP